MSDDGDNVFKLPVTKRPINDAPIRTVLTTGSKKCPHAHVEVDEKLGEVECSDCKAKLNPMWVLGELARKYKERLGNYRQLVVQSRIISQRLEQKQRCKCEHCGRLTRIRIDLTGAESSEIWQARYKKDLKGDEADLF